MTYLIAPMHFFLNVNLNEETEVLFTAAQDRCLRTNYTPPLKKKKSTNRMFHQCVGRVEEEREREVTLSYIMAEFKKLA